MKSFYLQVIDCRQCKSNTSQSLDGLSFRHWTCLFQTVKRYSQMRIRFLKTYFPEKNRKGISWVLLHYMVKKVTYAVVTSSYFSEKFHLCVQHAMCREFLLVLPEPERGSARVSLLPRIQKILLCQQWGVELRRCALFKFIYSLVLAEKNH